MVSEVYCMFRDATPPLNVAFAGLVPPQGKIPVSQCGSEIWLLSQRHLSRIHGTEIKPLRSLAGHTSLRYDVKP